MVLVTVPSSASCFDTLWTHVTVAADSKIRSGRTLDANPIVYSIKSTNSHSTKWSLHKRGRDVRAGRSQHQRLNCTNLIHFLRTAGLLRGKKCSSVFFFGFFFFFFFLVCFCFFKLYLVLLPPVNFCTSRQRISNFRINHM